MLQVIVKFPSQKLLRTTFALLIATYCGLAQAAIAGETIEFAVGGKKIKSHYLASNTKKCLIIISDRSSAPTEQQLLMPLQKKFNARKWQTLTLPWQANSKISTALLTHAIKHLQKNKCKYIFALGHGAGGDALLRFLVDDAHKALKGGVVLAAYPSKFTPEEQKQLQKIARPLFDIKAQHDYSQAQRAAARRRAIFRNLPAQRYRTLNMAGADHDFTYLTDVLTANIHNWAMHITQAKKAPTP